MSEEALLTEHRELVELYRHNWTSVFYLGVSFLILNGVLLSGATIILSLEQPIHVLEALALGAFGLAILANIMFLLFIARINVELTSLVNRAVTIENNLRDQGLSLCTFENCIVAIRQGRILVDSKGTFADLKPYQKLDIFKGIYLFTVAIGLAWVYLLVIYLQWFLH